MCYIGDDVTVVSCGVTMTTCYTDQLLMRKTSRVESSRYQGVVKGHEIQTRPWSKHQSLNQTMNNLSSLNQEVQNSVLPFLMKNSLNLTQTCDRMRTSDYKNEQCCYGTKLEDWKWSGVEIWPPRAEMRRLLLGLMVNFIMLEKLLSRVMRLHTLGTNEALHTNIYR